MTIFLFRVKNIANQFCGFILVLHALNSSEKRIFYRSWRECLNAALPTF
jgi:hypothetical protein